MWRKSRNFAAMKRQIAILCGCLILMMMTGCNNGKLMPAELAVADSLMEEHPDSALRILRQIGSTSDWTEHDRMLLGLLLSQAEDKNKVNRTSDSTMLIVAEYFEHHGSPRWKALAWFELGRISSDIGLSGQAISAYTHAMDTDTLSTDSALLSTRAKAAIWMGHTLMYQDLYAQAMPYFEKALALTERCKDRKTNVFSLRDIARCHVAQGNTTDGEARFVEAAHKALARKDTSMYKSVQVELSDLYLSTEDFERMRQCLDASMGLSGGDSSIVFNQMANYYLATGDTDSAAIFFRRGIHDANPYVSRDATLNLADLMAERGNFREAYQLLDKSISEDDSLTAVEQGQNANIIKTLSRKLEREKQQDRQLRRQTNIIYVFTLAFVCLWLFTYFTIRHKNLLNKMQRERAERLMAELRKAEGTERPKREQGIRVFSESDIYTAFHSQDFMPSLQDYHILEDALNATYDDCITKIRQLHDGLKDKEIHLCMLEKTEVPNKLICYYLGMEPNALSMLRARLYTKLFKQKGSADKFREFIKTL